jgi:hypothetical protein
MNLSSRAGYYRKSQAGEIAGWRQLRSVLLHSKKRSVAKPSYAAYTCTPVGDEIVNRRLEPE